MKTTSDKEVFEKIDASVNQMDTLRNNGLTDFEENQAIKNEILIRESKRLSEKYGSNHPRVATLNTRNANYGNMTIGLDSEKEKAAIKNDPFEGTSWRLHGKIFDEKLQPMEGLTVYFSDEKKQWIEKLGSFCTDKTGYFTLTLTEELIDRLKGVSIFTSVSDKNKRLLCLAKIPAVITKGKIDYIEIFIKGNNCIEPPTNKDDRTPIERGPINRGPNESTVDKPNEGSTKPADPSSTGNPNTTTNEPAGGKPSTKPSEGRTTKLVTPRIMDIKEEIKEQKENKNSRLK